MKKTSVPQWMGLTGNVQDEFAGSSWKVLKGSVLIPSKSLLQQVNSCRLLYSEEYDNWEIVVNIKVSPKKEMPIYVPADITMKKYEHATLLEPSSLTFFLLINEDKDSEYDLGKKTKEFLSNYSDSYAKKVVKLSEKYPIKLVCQAEPLQQKK